MTAFSLKDTTGLIRRTNQSSVDRRALYPTYNALVEGNLRDAYYAEKLRRMSSSTVGANVQVSLIGDFQGRHVT
jgi:hypothetical protein